MSISCVVHEASSLEQWAPLKSYKQENESLRITQMPPCRITVHALLCVLCNLGPGTRIHKHRAIAFLNADSHDTIFFPNCFFLLAIHGGHHFRSMNVACVITLMTAYCSMTLRDQNLALQPPSVDIGVVLFSLPLWTPRRCHPHAYTTAVFPQPQRG